MQRDVHTMMIHCHVKRFKGGVNNIMFGMKDDSHKIDHIYYIQFL